MTMENGNHQAPQLGDAANEPELEIVLVPDEAGEAGGAGDIEVELEPTAVAALLQEGGDFGANLAEQMSEDARTRLALEVMEKVELDLRDRKEWVRTYVDGIKLLGLKYERKTEPWPDACGVYHPMLAEAAVRFQSEAMTATFPASGPVKTKVIGRETPQKKEAATRVAADMNYQLTEVMTEYRGEHERMLWSLPIVGSAFKKVYFNHSLERPTSVFVSADDIVIPFSASSIQDAERVTHVMRLNRMQMEAFQHSGYYRDVDLQEPTGEVSDVEAARSEADGAEAVQDDRYLCYEVQIQLDMVEYGLEDPDSPDGISAPYVVTVDKGTNEVLAVRRNWEKSDPTFARRQHIVHYQYIPGFGAYGYGLLHLIGGYARSSTMLIRQLVDSGTLANLPGGFKTSGFRAKGGDMAVAPGEFKDVDIASGTLKENIMPLPYKEPSQTLYALLKDLVNEGRAFAMGGDLKVSDMSAQAPVGTTLALLERQLKVVSAVQARLHAAMKHEFKLLKKIVATDMGGPYDYEPTEGEAHERSADYAMVDVIPVSDPNAATMAQKIIQYQAALQLAQGFPQAYNMPLLHREMLDVLGIKNAAKILPLEEDMIPIDPVQENQNVLTGKPVKAFMEQDHKAHLAVHLAALQDPTIMQLVGQSPAAAVIQGAAMAHIQEHLALYYRFQVEERLGLPLPTMEETKQMDPAVAAKVAQMAAMAAQQVLQGNQAQAAQEQAQRNAEDPVLQARVQELEIKKMDAQTRRDKLQLEAQRLLADATAKMDDGEREDKELMLKAVMEAARLALAERKQLADEELAEENTQLKAMHYGNMGRAQDQNILLQDRRDARQAMERMQDRFERNNIGESRKEDTKDSGDQK